MWIILSVVAIVAIVIYMGAQRGKLFVKAYVYIKIYKKVKEEGKDDVSASMLANGYVEKYVVNKKNGSPFADEVLINEAKMFADSVYGGKQLPVIELARELGFAK